MVSSFSISAKADWNGLNQLPRTEGLRRTSVSSSRSITAHVPSSSTDCVTSLDDDGRADSAGNGRVSKDALDRIRGPDDYEKGFYG